MCENHDTPPDIFTDTTFTSRLIYMTKDNSNEVRPFNTETHMFQEYGYLESGRKVKWVGGENWSLNY